MRSDPDGYTILMGQMGTHAAAVALYPNLAYKPAEDFEPIGMVTGFPIIIAARRTSRRSDLKEFIAYLKANAGKLNQAHAGVGSIFFTTCLMLNSILGAKPTLVPFNGGAPAMNALVGGQVDLHVRRHPHRRPASRGRQDQDLCAWRRPRAIRRSPNVPTTAEAGLPEYEVSAWNGLFAPEGHAEADRRPGSSTRSTRRSTTSRRASACSCSAAIFPTRRKRGPAPFLALVKSEIARWSPIIKAANVKIE